MNVNFDPRARLLPLAQTGQAAQDAVKVREETRLKTALADFEAVFLKEMLTAMRSTVETTDLLGGGEAEKTFREMLDGEFAKEASRRPQGLGLKEALMTDLKKKASL